MEEAKFSLNIKFRWQGFDCQYTARSDENGGQTLMRGKTIIETLLAQGAVPNGAYQAKFVAPEAPAPFEPVCPVCGLGDRLELISFQRDGKQRKAWKCQRCSKWLPGDRGGA